MEKKYRVVQNVRWKALKQQKHYLSGRRPANDNKIICAQIRRSCTAPDAPTQRTVPLARSADGVMMSAGGDWRRVGDHGRIRAGKC